MDSETTRALVRRLVAAYAAGDADAIASLLHPDIDWVLHGPMDVFPFLGPRRGKDEVLASLAEIARQYELKRYVQEVLVVEGERAAAIVSAAFAQRSTGRTLSFRLANFMRLQDGLLIEFREFSDTFDVTQQALGRWINV